VVSRIRLYRVSSVLLRQRAVGEADRIVTLLTRERGKLSAIAKGVRRPRSKMAAGLQLFAHSRVQLAAGRSLAVVTQVEPVALLYHLREDIARYAHACYVAEMVDALLEEGHPDQATFELVLETLRGLDGGGDPATLVRGFELKLLKRLGYGPEVERCASCGAEVRGGRAGFSAPRGGVMCGRCVGGEGAQPLDAAALRAIRDLIRVPVQELAGRRLSRATAEELARVMRLFVDYQVGRPLRSAEFLQR
jgi:DNA repair protein RecO (recombination protein O)